MFLSQTHRKGVRKFPCSFHRHNAKKLGNFHTYSFYLAQIKEAWKYPRSFSLLQLKDKRDSWISCPFFSNNHCKIHLNCYHVLKLWMTTVYYLKKKTSSLSIWTKMDFKKVIYHHVFYTYVNRQPFSLKFGQYNGRRTCTVGKKVKKLILDGQTEIMQLCKSLRYHGIVKQRGDENKERINWGILFDLTPNAQD